MGYRYCYNGKHKSWYLVEVVLVNVLNAEVISSKSKQVTLIVVLHILRVIKNLPYPLLAHEERLSSWCFVMMS